jgi:hypothetical protein
MVGADCQVVEAPAGGNRQIKSVTPKKGDRVTNTKIDGHRLTSWRKNANDQVTNVTNII